MSKFESKPVVVERAAAEVAEKFSDLSKLQDLIDQLPAEEWAKLGEVKFENDSIHIHTSQVGEISFKIVERTDSRVRFNAIGSPVPVELTVNINALSVDSCEVNVVFDVNIPMMLRPMISPHMQKAVDMLGDMIGKVAQK